MGCFLGKNNLNLEIENRGKIKTFGGLISPEGIFSFWQNMDFEGTYLVRTLRSQPFRFGGEIKGNRLSAEYSVTYGNKVGVICSGEINLARKGTIEAKALLTGEDVEILKLEQQVAALNTKKSQPRRGKWDGEWVGSIGSAEGSCDFRPKLLSASIENNNLTLEIENLGKITAFGGPISPEGIFTFWQNMDFESAKFTKLKSVPFIRHA